MATIALAAHRPSW